MQALCHDSFVLTHVRPAFKELLNGVGYTSKLPRFVEQMGRRDNLRLFGRSTARGLLRERRAVDYGQRFYINF